MIAAVSFAGLLLLASEVLGQACTTQAPLVSPVISFEYPPILQNTTTFSNGNLVFTFGGATTVPNRNISWSTNGGCTSASGGNIVVAGPSGNPCSYTLQIATAQLAKCFSQNPANPGAYDGIVNLEISDLINPGSPSSYIRSDKMQYAVKVVTPASERVSTSSNAVNTNTSAALEIVAQAYDLSTKTFTLKFNTTTQWPFMITPTTCPFGKGFLIQLPVGSSAKVLTISEPDNTLCTAGKALCEQQFVVTFSTDCAGLNTLATAITTQTCRSGSSLLDCWINPSNVIGSANFYQNSINMRFASDATCSSVSVTVSTVNPKSVITRSAATPAAPWANDQGLLPLEKWYIHYAAPGLVDLGEFMRVNNLYITVPSAIPGLYPKVGAKAQQVYLIKDGAKTALGQKAGVSCNYAIAQDVVCSFTSTIDNVISWTTNLSLKDNVPGEDGVLARLVGVLMANVVTSYVFNTELIYSTTPSTNLRRREEGSLVMLSAQVDNVDSTGLKVSKSSASAFKPMCIVGLAAFSALLF